MTHPTEERTPAGQVLRGARSMADISEAMTGHQDLRPSSGEGDGRQAPYQGPVRSQVFWNVVQPLLDTLVHEKLAR
jgi:hypothetical protein